MNPLVYFFGTLPLGSSKFSCFPQDYTKQFFQYFISRAENCLQIVLHREDNLLYYAYVRQFGPKQYLGICLCIDCIYQDIRRLFVAFDAVFADMLEQGEIIMMDADAQIVWATESFSSDRIAINEYSRALIEKIGISENNTETLPPPDFSVPINDCLKISVEDRQSRRRIIDATKRYFNLYIVKKESEIERVTSFANALREKDNEISLLRKELNSDSVKRRIRKRDMTWMSALLAVVAVFVLVFYFYNLSPGVVADFKTGEYSYYGPMENKQPNGFGVAVYNEGDEQGRRYYIGSFNFGKRQDSAAVLVYKSGNIYYGSMDDDHLDEGIFYKVSDSAHFEGRFKNDKPVEGAWYVHEKAYDVSDESKSRPDNSKKKTDER